MKTREKIYRVIEPLGGDHRWSDYYDFFMMIVIVISLVPLAFKEHFLIFEWTEIFTLCVFVLDYFLRLVTADFWLKSKGKIAFFKYPFTPMAIIDLISILPSVSVVNSGFRLLRILRLIRTFRLFRIFKVFRYSRSISRIGNVLKKERDALIAVSTLTLGYILISALVVFNVEGESFDSFFEAVYWATVSLTTVGYGDIYPVSTIGRIVTMVSSVFGLAIIALPSSIITVGYLNEIYVKENGEKEDGNKENGI